MSDIDTSTAAVEAVAKRYERPYGQRQGDAVAEVLRALAAERDALLAVAVAAGAWTAENGDTDANRQAVADAVAAAREKGAMS